jgi:hypothetical protein
MHRLNAQRNLLERHRFDVGRLDGRGNQGIRQRAGPPAFRLANHTGPCRFRNSPSCTPTCRSPRARRRSHEPAGRWQAQAERAHGFESLEPAMLARQLLQGLLLRFGQFNGTFHGQAGDRDEIACQTRHSENRLLDTLNLSHIPRIVGMHVRDRRGYAERGHLIHGNFCLTVCSALSAVGRFNWRSQC